MKLLSRLLLPVQIQKIGSILYGIYSAIESGVSEYGANLRYRQNNSHNSGDDLAGVVHSVGPDVYEFKPGDRVAAFHEVGTDNGGFAEYAVAPDYTTFHIPNQLSFEEAATIPVAALTAAMALYNDMRLPTPSDIKAPTNGGKQIPLLIYGVTSACGAFAAKLARLSGFHPLIGIAGRASEFAGTLVDHVIDYREGEDAMVAAIETALSKEGFGKKAPYVLDAISESGSFEATLRFIDHEGGTVRTLLPPEMFAKDKDNFKWPTGVDGGLSRVPNVHSISKDFGFVWLRYIGRLLADGRLSAHPYEVIPGGLHGVLEGLHKLKDGKASGVKYVYKIDETGDTGVVRKT
jgi:NADPH:quinone reductase